MKVGQSMQKNMVSHSALYFIRNKWPLTSSPLFFSFLLLFLVSHYQDSFSKTHNHLCSCSYHPEILTCVSSVLLLNVHAWINVRCLSSFFDAWVNYIVCLCFLNENMVKPVQNDGVFCRALQKTLSKLERVCKQVKCVKSFEKYVFVLRTVWMVWKIGPNESVIVC